MNNIRKLKADEIECRVAQVSAKGCSLLLYKTARVDRALLDEAYGDKWQCDFKEIKGCMYGGIAVYNDELKEWLWRWDCGSESNVDAEKGQASDCFKRAGFKWGIGVELYTAPFIWINVETQAKDKGKFELVDKFAKFDVKEIGYSDSGTINHLVIVDKSNKEVFRLGKHTKAETKPQQTKQQEKQVELDEDFDIVQAVITFDDIDNLKIYFNENKSKVKNLDAFRTACTMRKQYILEKQGA